MNQLATPVTRLRPVAVLLVLAGVAAAVLWAYWTTLQELASRWGSDPQYSHGYLVPGFAVVLLWLRRDRLPSDLQPSWLGLPLLAGGLALRLYGTYFHYVWFDALSLLPCLAGLCLLGGGLAAFRWAWPSVAFLFYMIPLPFRLASALSEPLQRLATVVSTFALQTLGLPALSEGNVILLNETEIGIVEACSGLRMLVIFFALSSAVALVMKRPVWERLVVVVSAIPIALFANLVRITVTGVLHETVGSEIANAVFHDLAGWLMMPLALFLLWLELLLLKNLWIEATPEVPARMNYAPVRRREPKTSPPRQPSPRDRKPYSPPKAAPQP